jgi:ABC-2 type transport system ATP-binding protein
MSSVGGTSGAGDPLRSMPPPATEHRQVIETHALRKQFGATLAVADLSLHVGAGEIFGFLGPNGAGKTTAIKMLLALVEPTSGTGQVMGAPLGDRAVRAHIGFLPEHFRFHDTLTATELLRFHGRLYGLRGVALDARIDRLLTRVDLLDAADRPLRGYSKGMLQRVGLAQALLNEPQLVFLDEPTSGLDPLGRLLVRSIIDELRADQVTVFLNSHLLGEVEATCDRVAFVKRGRVVAERRLSSSGEALDLELRVALPAEASPPSLLPRSISSFGEPRQSALRGGGAKAEPVRAAILEGLSRFGTNVVQPRPGLIALRTEGDAVIPAIVSWLVHQGVQIHAVQPRRKSLEDVFLEVMGEDERPG